jgi:hypothetical protein
MILRCMALWPLVLLSLLAACREATLELVTDAPPARDAASSIDDAAARADAALPRARCEGRLCACDDGLSNDEDGLIDGADPECTGAFDDDEASFATGTPRFPGRCLDCFWDDNGTKDDDACAYPKQCREGKAPPTKGQCTSCEVPSACAAACAVRTPNGCDCFGCCAIERAGGEIVLVTLEDRCSLAKLDDEAECPRCVQSDACINPCGRCELCPGRSADSLPDDCDASAPSGSPEWSCDTGKRCTRSSDCGSDWYCQLGCCLPVVL